MPTFALKLGYAGYRNIARRSLAIGPRRYWLPRAFWLHPGLLLCILASTSSLSLCLRLPDTESASLASTLRRFGTLCSYARRFASAAQRCGAVKGCFALPHSCYVCAYASYLCNSARDRIAQRYARARVRFWRAFLPCLRFAIRRPRAPGRSCDALALAGYASAACNDTHSGIASRSARDSPLLLYLPQRLCAGALPALHSWYVRRPCVKSQ